MTTELTLLQYQGQTFIEMGREKVAWLNIISVKLWQTERGDKYYSAHQHYQITWSATWKTYCVCCGVHFQENSKLQKTIKGHEEEIKKLKEAIEFRDNFLAVSFVLVNLSFCQLNTQWTNNENNENRETVMKKKNGKIILRGSTQAHGWSCNYFASN